MDGTRPIDSMRVNLSLWTRVKGGRTVLNSWAENARMREGKWHRVIPMHTYSCLRLLSIAARKVLSIDVTVVINTAILCYNLKSLTRRARIRLQSIPDMGRWRLMNGQRRAGRGYLKQYRYPPACHHSSHLLF